MGCADVRLRDRAAQAKRDAINVCRLCPEDCRFFESSRCPRARSARIKARNIKQQLVAAQARMEHARIVMEVKSGE